MIKLTNLSDKNVDLSRKVSIPAYQFVTGDIEITPRIQQMISMGILELSKVNKEVKDDKPISTYELRKKQVLEDIKAGHTKPSIPLNNVIHETPKTVTKRNLKNKKVGEK